MRMENIVDINIATVAATATVAAAAAAWR